MADRSRENLPLRDETGRQFLYCGERSWIYNVPLVLWMTSCFYIMEHRHLTTDVKICFICYILSSSPVAAPKAKSDVYDCLVKILKAR